MVECRDCGVEFFDECEPLATICVECRDQRDTYYAEWLVEHADNLAITQSDADDDYDETIVAER